MPQQSVSVALFASTRPQSHHTMFHDEQNVSCTEPIMLSSLIPQPTLAKSSKLYEIHTYFSHGGLITSHAQSIDGE